MRVKIQPNCPIRTVMSFDRRREVRVPWRCNVQLHIGEGEFIAATLFDVSRSGIAVNVERWIDVGASIRVEGDGFAIQGTVSRCEPGPSGYTIGVHCSMSP
jgi:PilZ domain